MKLHVSKTKLYDNNEHKNWQVFFKDDNNRGTGAFCYKMGDSPTGNGTLYFMNPLNKDWQNYIFNEYKKVFEYFDFDGWHGDTVGDWGHGNCRRTASWLYR